MLLQFLPLVWPSDRLVCGKISCNIAIRVILDALLISVFNCFNAKCQAKRINELKVDATELKQPKCSLVISLPQEQSI